MGSDLVLSPNRPMYTRRGPSRSWTMAEAIEALVNAIEAHGGRPSRAELRDRYSCPSDSTCRKMFGSMREAWLLAELEVGRRAGEAACRRELEA